MSKSNWELWALVIAIVEFDLNYYVYLRTQSLVDILTIIVASLILALMFIISHVYVKLKENSDMIEELDKRLKLYKELENIRVDVRELKNEVFRK